MSIQEQQRRSGFLSSAALRAGASRNQSPGPFASYSPGAAQPRQPQASGTPYGAPPSNLERMPQIFDGNMAYKQPQGQGAPYGRYAAGTDVSRLRNTDTLQPMPSGGNMAYANPGMRPPPFTASYQGFDGSVSNQPNYAQRDAFINQITGQLGQMQNQSWQQPMGAPQFNFPGMWNQAGQMVQQGWQNPMAQFGKQPQGGMPGMHDSNGDGVDDRLRNIYRPTGAAQPTPPPSQGTPYSPGVQSPPGYGMPRTADMRDRNGDGIDDRDAGYGPRRQTSKNYTPRNAYRTL